MKHYYFMYITKPNSAGKVGTILLVSDTDEGLSIHEERPTRGGTRVRRIPADSAYKFMRCGTYPECFGKLRFFLVKGTRRHDS